MNKERKIQNLSVEQLAGMIDHTFLKAYGTGSDIEQLCTEAVKYRFPTVMVHPSEIGICRKLLFGTNIHIGTVVGFPLGQNTTESKVFETKDAIGKGVNEIDMVINIRTFQKKQYDSVIREIENIVSICRGHQVICKVILETCYLTDMDKEKLCLIALNAGADFVKTSTGFGTKGATIEDIILMRRTIGGEMGIKASGGIHDPDTALAMINAGATRIGTSGSVAIIESYRKQKSNLQT